MRFVFKIWQISLVPVFAVGTQFLTLPSSAQELAIGSHPTSFLYSSVNPALYNAHKSNPKFSISQGSWFGGASNSHISYNQRFKTRTLHFRIDHTDLSDLELRNNKPIDKPLAYFSAFGFSATIGLSNDFRRGSYGFSFSRIRMGIFNQSADGYTLGGGYLYRINKSLSIGLSITNLGIISKFESEKSVLPTRISVGFEKKIRFISYTDNIYATIEWNKFSAKYQFLLGNTFRWKSLIIMAGSSFNQDVFTSSTGFGLESKGYSVRYGIRFGSQNIGYPQSISIGIPLP
tara:strand:+ start:3127 stop:3993 length:867 start_codon:yes stop_codon:yes gene_type:complete